MPLCRKRFIYFTASKQKGGVWFVHPVGYPDYPEPDSYGDKKKVFHIAARMNRMTYKDFVKARRELEDEV